MTLLEEADDEIRVEVVSLRSGGEECLDLVEVELDDPLGDRLLIDLTSGRSIRVDER